MCCSSPPPPPDLSGVTEASEEVARMNQQTAMEQLQWAREQDAMNRETLERVLNIQLPVMEEQAEQARSDRERYQRDFVPVEDAMREEALGYDSEERRAQERGRAMSQVSQQFDAQRQNALSRLESYGVDPSQTRNAALDIGVRTAQAAAMAGAASGADRRIEDTGRALRSDVVNMGRGALSNAAGFYGQAVNSGSAAVSGGNQTTSTGAGAAQSAMGWSGQALQGYGQAGNMMNQNFQNQMTSWQAGQDQTMGMLNAAGSIAGMMIADGGEVDPSLATKAIPAENYGAPGAPYTGDGEVMGPSDGSGIDDQVPAMLSDGEYVIPADVVRKKGEEFFDKLIEKYHTPAAEQRRGAV